MLLDLGDPVPYGFEGTTIGYVVYEENTLSTSKITRGDGPEPLLAGGVPDLELDAFGVDFDVFDFEVYANGCYEGGGEGVVGVAEEEAGFAYAGIADH